jgi:hypothetical protein
MRESGERDLEREAERPWPSIAPSSSLERRFLGAFSDSSEEEGSRRPVPPLRMSLLGVRLLRLSLDMAVFLVVDV